MRTILFFIVLFLTADIIYAQSPASQVRKGNKQYENKEYSEAEKNYRHALETEPGSFPGNYNLGSALYRQEKHEDAARQYLQGASAGASKEEQARAYYNMGNSLLKAGKFQESVEAYKLSLRNNPGDANAQYNLSYALSKLKQQQQQQQQQNKDQKKDQNKDQQKQEQEQQKQEQQQQEQKQPKISKEDAERMLEALKNDEKNLQKKKAKRYEARSSRPEKDW